MLAESINQYFTPLREKRNILAQNPAAVWDILQDGAKRASTIAEATMVEVRKAVGLPE